jgi:glycosyltransferase 2 family protein
MQDPKVAPPVDDARGHVESPTARSPKRAAIGRLVGSRPVRWVFVLGAVALAGYAIARDWKQITTALGHLGFLSVAAALVSVVIAQILTSQMWRQLLASLGSPLSAGAAARILFIGQLGKYLPGSIWPVLAQMELGKAHQVPRSRSASASVLVMLLTLITGLLIALVTLPFAAGPMPYRWALLITPVLLAMLYPKVLNRIIGWLLRLARQAPLEAPLTARTLSRALAWAVGVWICYGLQIWILATRLGAPAGKTALIALGGFAFAWSVGFVIVFAPAGAGVRDVLLLLMLRPVLSTADATAVVLVSRVLLTAADLLTAAAATRLGRRPYPAVNTTPD